MGTTTAKCPAAPKPQPPPPPMPRPGPDHPPPPAMTVAELEAAVAALPGKRDALREAFDRLAACSPTPLPFAWEDLDAHLFWLLSSISLRFRQVRALESARPAPAFAAPGKTCGDGTGEQLEGEELVVEMEEVVVVEQEEEEKGAEEMENGDNNETGDKISKDATNEKGGRDEVLEEEEVEIGNAMKEEKDAREEEQDADEKMHMSNVEEQSTKDGKKASQDKEEDSNMEMEEDQSTKDAKKASQDKEEQNIEDAKKASRNKEEDANMEEAATKRASTLQGKEQEVCREKQVEEEQEAHDEEQDAKNTTKEEKATNVSRDQANQAHPGPCVFTDLAAAFSGMDARRLVKLIHTIVGLSSEFHAAMHHAPDGAALSLRVVDLFLHDKMLKSNKVWANCVGLIRTVPEVVTKISTESIERAKQLAKDWREMIDSSGTRTTLGSHASWGLLNFLIAYNIVSEFDTEEIFRIFGTIPRKYQKNHSMLFKGLGLTDRIPELMDYLIGNGQHMNALYLLPFFNLVDKYPPFSILKGHVEKAKQTVMEISQKKMTRQSLRAVIMKELDNLRMARDLANQQITDSGLHTCIMAEIYVLLGEFEKMKRSLADASTPLTSNPRQQQTRSNKKRKKEQEQHKAQENKQQTKRSKPGKKLEKKQNKPQQEQQQKQKDKPQGKQQQNKRQHSKRPRKRTPKQPAQSSPVAQNVPLRGHFGHPPYASVHGVHHDYPAQPGWPGVHCAPPFAPQPGAPEYIGPFNPFFPRPELYPQ